MIPVSLDFGRSLREGFFMFWETLWPLVLGFGLAGAVQAFASRDSMRRQLGNHRPAAVARATVFGMLSSSCSYAASAMSKSLFAKGADFVAVNVFMFASTNLVVELGIVLVVLLGWSFALSELVGGVIMILLMTLLGGLYLRGELVVAAGRSLGVTNEGGASVESALPREPLSRRLRSKKGWADASTYTMSDLTMLRKELFIGYTIAGFLAVLVPVHVWNAAFFHGHGLWTSVENALVGPLVALLSCVCSVGNVPLAAALWHGGISFGGVVSFLFADLIALPLLLVYRRFYGIRLMLRMLVVFWTVMSVAGFLTQGIFSASGLVPHVAHTEVTAPHFSLNATTYLNVGFLTLFGVLYWAYRNRQKWGDDHRYALDPVCAMVVEKALAPATGSRDGLTFYFCSDRCAARFEDAHGSHGDPGEPPGPMGHAVSPAAATPPATV